MALEVGRRWVNTATGTSMEVVSPSEIRRVIKPGKGKLKAHYQLDYVERFVIESGRATIRHKGATIDLGPGDEYEIQPCEAHVNPYNRGTEDLVFRQSAEPLVPFVEGFVKTYGAALEARRTNRQDEVRLPALFAVATRVETPSYAAGIPRPLQHLAFPLGAAYARMLGIPVAL